MLILKITDPNASQYGATTSGNHIATKNTTPLIFNSGETMAQIYTPTTQVAKAFLLAEESQLGYLGNFSSTTFTE